MNLLSRNRAMLDALGHDVHLPRPERDGSIAKLNIQHTLKDEKKSSVSSCLCQTNSPSTFTTMTSQSLNLVTVRGDQCSENVDSFSAKSIPLLIYGPWCLFRRLLKRRRARQDHLDACAAARL